MTEWLALAVMGCASAGATAPGAHTAVYELARPGQDPLPVRASWSDGAEPMPVIVFSHGLGGSRDGYDGLVAAWVDRGYLVLQPTHPDSLAFVPRSQRLAFARDPKAFAAEHLDAWDERPAEVSYVLDHLDALTPLGVDPARVDAEHVGIGGHSFGAHTAALCGGLVTLGGGDHAEPRADAILMLSPQGVGAGIPPHGYGGITKPAMVVTGSEDVSPITGQGPEWRLSAWKSLGSTDRWLLFLDGATHTLGGMNSRVGRLTGDPELASAVNDATSAFWDATLRGDAAARDRLDHGVTRPAGPRIHLTRGGGAD